MDSLTSFLEAPVNPLAVRQLRRINLYVRVNDALLRVMVVHLPLLTHIAVTAVDLSTSHVDASCNWEELCIAEELHTTTLARLPLRGTRKLEVSNVCRQYAVYEIAAELAAALAAAPDCVLSCTRRPNLNFECSAEELEVLLPRWQCGAAVQSLTLCSDSRPLTPAVLGALVSLLERTPSCKELCIDDFAPPAPPESPPLLPALRNTAICKVGLRHLEMTESELLAWCAGGKVGHRIVVRLQCDFMLYERSHATVRQALKAAGSDVILGY
jgi:hypothetical protein